MNGGVLISAGRVTPRAPFSVFAADSRRRAAKAEGLPAPPKF